VTFAIIQTSITPSLKKNVEAWKQAMFRTMQARTFRDNKKSMLFHGAFFTSTQSTSSFTCVTPCHNVWPLDLLNVGPLTWSVFAEIVRLNDFKKSLADVPMFPEDTCKSECQHNGHKVRAYHPICCRQDFTDPIRNLVQHVTVWKVLWPISMRPKHSEVAHPVEVPRANLEFFTVLSHPTAEMKVSIVIGDRLLLVNVCEL
jgi:hypothetical protein